VIFDVVLYLKVSSDGKLDEASWKCSTAG